VARLIRIVDAATVPKAGKKSKENNGLWRIHAVFNLPAERFTGFELIDERGGETSDRAEVVPGASSPSLLGCQPQHS